MLTLGQIEVIRAIMVTGTVGGAARLRNVTAAIRPGALTVIGSNGAGKSTMFKTIFGLLPRIAQLFLGDGLQAAETAA